MKSTGPVGAQLPPLRGHVLGPSCFNSLCFCFLILKKKEEEAGEEEKKKTVPVSQGCCENLMVNVSKSPAHVCMVSAKDMFLYVSGEHR